jgi:hypothetical protein
VQAQADTIPSPRCARQYRALLLDTGFTEVTVEIRTAVFTNRSPVAAMLSAADAAAHTGKASRTDIDAWLAEQDTRARADRFLAVVPVFVAAATRPRQDTGGTPTGAGGRGRPGRAPATPPVIVVTPFGPDAYAVATPPAGPAAGAGSVRTYGPVLRVVGHVQSTGISGVVHAGLRGQRHQA